MDQDQPKTNSEQDEHNTVSLTERTPPAKTNDSSLETPAPPKKEYEVMKDPAFLSSPEYPLILHSKPSLSTNRDDHLITILSHDHFTFKSQLALFICILLTSHSNGMIQIKVSLLRLFQKSCLHSSIGSKTV